MNDNELNKLHDMLLVITDEIDRICRKNNITYTLVGGSMLGAARHKGFIPWDDDIDIAMKRSEFDRFLIACEEDLGESFELLTNENNKDYVYGFSKLLLKGTCLVEKGLENVRYPQKIFVDLFCYDNIPDSYIKRKKQKYLNIFLKKVLRQKQGLADNPEWSMITKTIYKGLGVISRLRSTSSWVAALNRNMIKYNNQKTRDVCNIAGYYKYEIETIPASSLNHTSYIPFEDRSYQVCDNYREILRTYYGDYMKLPPVEQRRTHGFSKLDFGKF